MKANRLLGALLAAGLGLMAVTAAPTDAAAQGKSKGGKAVAPPAAEPPDTKNQIAPAIPGLKWQMSVKQVTAVVNQAFDLAYRPLYQAVSPGVKMKALDASLAEEKDIFARSRIDFGKLPTTIDATPLKGEYSYNNKESMMTFVREGRKVHLFFIQDKLWKSIDEIALSDKSVYGKDFTAATVKLSKDYGVPGRILEAAPDKGRFATEVDWKDPTTQTHARAIQRGDAAFALLLEDMATVSNLASLRPNKPAEEAGIDPAVAAALNKNMSSNQGPTPPPEPAGKPAKGGKK